jgi:hypothetical protein
VNKVLLSRHSLYYVIFFSAAVVIVIASGVHVYALAVGFAAYALTVGPLLALRRHWLKSRDMSASHTNRMKIGRN